MKRFRPGHAPPRARGFTLIELLIVISIIAILAALMFPTFARVRENARRASCMSNLKQIGLGLMQYTQDFDETFPVQASTAYGGEVSNYANTSTVNWISSVQPYAKSWQIFRCPSATPYSGSTPNAAPILTPNPSDTGYSANAVILAQKLSVLRNSADLIFVQELDTAYQVPWIFPAFVTGVNRSTPAKLTDTFENYLYGQWNTQHFGGGNLLFADGHVKWRKQNSICGKEYGLTVTVGNACGVNTNGRGTVDTTQLAL